ncbi:MAG: transcriptional repressor LexA [bacterium]|nr:transcriptional repressor LexA [bacterium]
MKEVSGSRKKVLESIEKLRKRSGYSPTVREVASDLGFKSTKAVFVHMKNLHDMGLIERKSGISRGISSRDDFSIVPLLGRISAGLPLSSESDIEDSFIMEGSHKERFFLRINGESMTGAGLEHNSMVLVDRSLQTKSGDIVVALLNGELTIKRYFEKENEIFLLPENEKYSEIEIKKTDDFSIVGKVIGFIKSV